MRTIMRFTKLLFIISFIFLLPTVMAAESVQNIINQGIRDSEIATKKIAVNSDSFKKAIPAINKADAQAKTFNHEIKSIHTKNLNTLKDPTKNLKGNVIQPIGTSAVFVSFSMPEPSLKQIIAAANHYHVPVVVRGLYQNSLKETANKILVLTKANNQGGILINPVWFKKYEIKAVPAFLVTEHGAGQDNNSYDLVYGNVPLKRALTIIAEQGEYAKEAVRILAAAGGR
jgi:type-F conjugative transfer system pilin assembly protein TrbC